jgi:hypothetical protein
MKGEADVTRLTGRPTARTNESAGGDFYFYFQVWPRHFGTIDIFSFRRFYFAASALILHFSLSAAAVLPQILDNTPRRRGPFGQVKRRPSISTFRASDTLQQQAK